MLDRLTEFDINQRLENRISHAISKAAESYINMIIAGRNIRCPYYMNLDKLYEGTKYYRRVKIGGKMSSAEIVNEINHRSSMMGINLSDMSSQQIRDFIFEIGAGIDCSGYVYNISKSAFEDVSSLCFDNHIHKPNERDITGVTKISATDIVNPENCFSVDRVRDIKPADIITVAGGRHVISILEIQGDSIICSHSTNVITSWGPNNFNIHVIKPEIDIYNQEWDEVDWTGAPYIEGVRLRLEYNDGVKRLKAFDMLYSSNIKHNEK